MYHRNMGSYDEIPDGMKRYINNYGCHINDNLFLSKNASEWRIIMSDKERTIHKSYKKHSLHFVLLAKQIFRPKDII